MDLEEYFTSDMLRRDFEEEAKDANLGDESRNSEECCLNALDNVDHMPIGYSIRNEEYIIF